MITPSDREIISAMVGSDFVEMPGKMPPGFVEEYQKRLGMMNRAGVTGHGLGPALCMSLLRDYNIEKDSVGEDLTVENWRRIPHGTLIYCEGKRGQFRGMTGTGTILIRLEGLKADHEVHGSQVTLAKSLVADVPDEVFEKSADDIPSPKAQMLEGNSVQEAKDEKPADSEDKDDPMLTWGSVELGAEIPFDYDGNSGVGKFVDLNDADEIVLDFNGRILMIPASEIEAPSLANN